MTGAWVVVGCILVIGWLVWRGVGREGVRLGLVAP